MYLNYELYYRGILFWASIESPKFSSTPDNMFLFCSAVSCVHLKENTGGLSNLTGFSIKILIVVTIQDTWYFCFWSSQPLRIFAIFIPLSSSWSWLSVIFLSIDSLGVVYLGLVCVTTWEVSVTFDIFLDNYFVSLFSGRFPKWCGIENLTLYQWICLYVLSITADD